MLYDDEIRAQRESKSNKNLSISITPNFQHFSLLKEVRTLLTDKCCVMKSLGLLLAQKTRQEFNFFNSFLDSTTPILAILTPYSNIFLMDVCFRKKARFVTVLKNHGRNIFRVE